MRTRVRFADGAEETGAWGSVHGSPAAVLAAAVALAELARGQPHDGAWLEFSPGGSDPRGKRDRRDGG